MEQFVLKVFFLISVTLFNTLFNFSYPFFQRETSHFPEEFRGIEGYRSKGRGKGQVLMKDG